MSMRVNFTPAEEEKLKRKSERVGLSMSEYVRQQALNGTVRGYNVEPVLAHTKLLGEVARAVKDFTSLPHSDRWLYEADLERIEKMLVEVKRTESDLLDLMRRKMR